MGSAIAWSGIIPPPPTCGRAGVGEASDDRLPPKRGFPLPDLPHVGGGDFSSCSAYLIALPCGGRDVFEKGSRYPRFATGRAVSAALISDHTPSNAWSIAGSVHSPAWA